MSNKHSSQMSREPVISDGISLFQRLPDRLLVVTVLGALVFGQLALVSDYVQRANVPPEGLGTVYSIISALLVVYIALPIFWFGLSHRDVRIGQAAIAQAALPILSVISLWFLTGVVSVLIGVALSYGSVFGFMLILWVSYIQRRGKSDE